MSSVFVTVLYNDTRRKKKDPSCNTDGALSYMTEISLSVHDKNIHFSDEEFYQLYRVIIYYRFQNAIESSYHSDLVKLQEIMGKHTQCLEKLIQRQRDAKDEVKQNTP